MKTRIYRVAQTTTKGEAVTLVRAANRSAAERHVSKATVAAEVCGQDDLIKLVLAGAEVEDASGEDVLDADIFAAA